MPIGIDTIGAIIDNCAVARLVTNGRVAKNFIIDIRFL